MSARSFFVSITIWWFTLSANTLATTGCELQFQDFLTDHMPDISHAEWIGKSVCTDSSAVLDSFDETLLNTTLVTYAREKIMAISELTTTPRECLHCNIRTGSRKILTTTVCTMFQNEYSKDSPWEIQSVKPIRDLINFLIDSAARVGTFDISSTFSGEKACILYVTIDQIILFGDTEEWSWGWVKRKLLSGQKNTLGLLGYLAELLLEKGVQKSFHPEFYIDMENIYIENKELLSLLDFIDLSAQQNKHIIFRPEIMHAIVKDVTDENLENMSDKEKAIVKHNHQQSISSVGRAISHKLRSADEVLHQKSAAVKVFVDAVQLLSIKDIFFPDILLSSFATFVQQKSDWYHDLPKRKQKTADTEYCAELNAFSIAAKDVVFTYPSLNSVLRERLVGVVLHNDILELNEDQGPIRRYVRAASRLYQETRTLPDHVLKNLNNFVLPDETKTIRRLALQAWYIIGQASILPASLNLMALMSSVPANVGNSQVDPDYLIGEDILKILNTQSMTCQTADFQKRFSDLQVFVDDFVVKDRVNRVVGSLKLTFEHIFPFIDSLGWIYQWNKVWKLLFLRSNWWFSDAREMAELFVKRILAEPNKAAIIQDCREVVEYLGDYKIANRLFDEEGRTVVELLTELKWESWTAAVRRLYIDNNLAFPITTADVLNDMKLTSDSCMEEKSSKQWSPHLRETCSIQSSLSDEEKRLLIQIKLEVLQFQDRFSFRLYSSSNHVPEDKEFLDTHLVIYLADGRLTGRFSNFEAVEVVPGPQSDGVPYIPEELYMEVLNAIRNCAEEGEVLRFLSADAGQLTQLYHYFEYKGFTTLRKNVRAWKEADLQSWKKATMEAKQALYPNIQLLSERIAVLEEVFKRSESGKRLRDPQLFAIILMSRYGQKYGGMYLQMFTGEGKSFVILFLAVLAVRKKVTEHVKYYYCNISSYIF